jgi:1-aminocyclopropane-1-carboxylate deaminase/D-cysteine desulfhydrase-like pyridoxal-dependent ACC family enzyme
MSSIIQKTEDLALVNSNIELFVKREDLVHSIISGNKWHKLRYNIQNAKKRGNTTLLTFGGAYSNHIEATAIAGKEFGFKTIGIIRGEETLPLNSTIKKAKECGMQLVYVSRAEYKNKHTQDYIESLREVFGSFYLIPEGGSNFYAINGCMEILNETDTIYDYICCPLGTGGTASGIALSLKGNQKLLGFPALKGGEFLLDEMKTFINMVVNDTETTQDVLNKVQLITDYHFGGYAKINEELISFLQDFNVKHNIKWDLIYNGKMVFGVYDLIKKGFFPKGSKILLIHTGGLQGVNGFEERFGFKMYSKSSIS